MDYEQLKKEIKEIAAIAESVPEPFRQKCFEVLLNSVLGKQTQSKPPKHEEKEQNKDELPPKDEDEREVSTLNPPGVVKAFMRKRDVSSEQMEALVMIVDGEFHFLKEPSHDEVRRGQNEWALLLALKNALLNNGFKADPEDVRSIVQDKGFYNAGNFATNFKADKYGTYFKEALKPQGTAQPITQDGEKALAELIESLTAT